MADKTSEFVLLPDTMEHFSACGNCFSTYKKGPLPSFGHHKKDHSKAFPTSFYIIDRYDIYSKRILKIWKGHHQKFYSLNTVDVRLLIMKSASLFHR